MAYVTLADVQAKIPPQFLVQALDDNQDGEIDAGLWELIQSQAQDSVDSRIGQRYAVPLSDPVPAVARNAALIFACEGVYARRVGPDANPWMGMANSLRAKLDRIGNGDEPLTPDLQRKAPSVGVVAEPSRTHSARTAV